MRVNGSLLKSDIFSKKSKVIYFCTPAKTLEREKSNSSSFSEAMTGKLCTEFKIEESLENAYIEGKYSFSSITKIRMSSSGSYI